MQTEKMLTLMQFARKAGKLVSGHDATLRAAGRNHLHLIITAEDASPRTIKNLKFSLGESKLQTISFGSQAEFGRALGLPNTAVFGVLDKNFAGKLLEYFSAQD